MCRICRGCGRCVEVKSKPLPSALLATVDFTAVWRTDSYAPLPNYDLYREDGSEYSVTYSTNSSDYFSTSGYGFDHEQELAGFDADIDGASDASTSSDCSIDHEQDLTGFDIDVDAARDASLTYSADSSDRSSVNPLSMHEFMDEERINHEQDLTGFDADIDAASDTSTSSIDSSACSIDVDGASDSSTSSIDSSDCSIDLEQDLTGFDIDVDAARDASLTYSTDSFDRSSVNPLRMHEFMDEASIDDEQDLAGSDIDVNDTVCPPTEADDLEANGEVSSVDVDVVDSPLAVEPRVVIVDVGVDVDVVDSTPAVETRVDAETAPVLRRSARLQEARRRRLSVRSTGRFVSSRVTRANVRAGRATLCTHAIT